MNPFRSTAHIFMPATLTLVPRPLQKPHPPVRIAANSPDTFPFAAGRRLPIFASPLINPPDKLKAGLSVYRQGLPADHPRDTALAFPFHVATSREMARAQCEPGLVRFLRVATEAALPATQLDDKSFEAFRQVRARMASVTYADIDRDMGVFGDPDYYGSGRGSRSAGRADCGPRLLSARRQPQVPTGHWEMKMTNTRGR